MIQRSTVPDEIAEQIAARIAGAMRPWRIVLFGSRARGDAKPDSDYDVFVEVDVAHTALREADDHIRTLFYGSGWSIDFKVRPIGEIERRRDDPGTIEWDVAREGRLLYADPDAPSVLAPPRRVSEPSPNSPKSLEEWLESAERDLRHRELLATSKEDYSPEICGLSHQTCEKHMKALLVSRWVRPKRTHDLGELLEALRVAGCALPRLDADCALLSKHAITPRYPAGLHLTANDARVATDAANRVLAAVRAELPGAS
jgi:HEPN domain-containing protein